jgi:hypothetical protein
MPSILGPARGAWDEQGEKGGPDMQTAGLRPEDVRFLQNIKAREALAQAMQDPVLARTDLNKIIDTYNQLSGLAPRAFSEASTLAPTLRQAIEQPDQSLHDLSQLQNVEKGLMSQDSSPVQVITSDGKSNG